MQPLDPPDPQAWRRRAAWFADAQRANAGPHLLDLPAAAEALLAELELVYCAGAWDAAVILAWALVEGEQRRLAGLGRDPPEGPETDWLRARRNALVHVAAQGEPAPRAEEADAQGALRVALRALYAGAW